MGILVKSYLFGTFPYFLDILRERVHFSLFFRYSAGWQNMHLKHFIECS